MFDPPYGFSAEVWDAENPLEVEGETCRPTSCGEGRRGVIKQWHADPGT